MSSPPAGRGGNALLIVGIVLGLLIPIIGFIIAIVLFVQGRSQQGLIVLGATIVGILISVALFL